MITIQQVDNALRNVYQEAVTNEINTRTNPFLTMISDRAKNINRDEARTIVRYGHQDSVRAGIEGGELPSANGDSAEIIVPLKNLYGTFQISDKAVRALLSSSGELSDTIDGEMRNLVATAQRALNNALYANGQRLLGFSNSVVVATRRINMHPRFARNFSTGQVFQVQCANNVVLAELTVETVGQDFITYATGVTLTPGNHDRLYLYEVENGIELSGIDAIFRQDSLYNLDRNAHRDILPFTHVASNASLQLNTFELGDFLHGYEDHCQSLPADIFLTNPTVKRGMFNELAMTRLNFDPVELRGGFSGFRYNGLPVYSDVACKGGTWYALNSDSWNMHQLADWTWFNGDEGGVLRQIDGRAGYTATLAKYADLVCEKPFLQGKATGYSANRF